MKEAARLLKIGCDCVIMIASIDVVEGSERATHLQQPITRLQSTVSNGGALRQDVFNIDWGDSTSWVISGSDTETQTFRTWKRLIMVHYGTAFLVMGDVSLG